MSFLFVTLYGLFSGFFEVLPVSSFAHQSIIRHIFGVKTPLHLYNFLLHIAMLSAVILTSMPSISALVREQRILSLPRRALRSERKFTYELRFIKPAAFAVSLSSAIVLFVGKQTISFLAVAILCVLNGALVLTPEFLPYGNKTAKHLNRLDAVAFGLFGGLGIVPGISRISVMQGYASARGVDKVRASNWVLLTSIPVLFILILFDLVGMFSVGIGGISFVTILSFMFGSILCFVATFGGITIFRFLSAKVGFAGFGYYSIGAGLLAFFLYLTV